MGRATEAASAKGEGRACPEGPGRSAEKGFKMSSAWPLHSLSVSLPLSRSNDALASQRDGRASGLELGSVSLRRDSLLVPVAHFLIPHSEGRKGDDGNKSREGRRENFCNQP